ncbi:MAG: SCO family protein [Ectothiorhodospiraceae bacterium]|nr:SCO family protein [Ectothiorhodospiraceae bacterium]
MSVALNAVIPQPYHGKPMRSLARIAHSLPRAACGGGEGFAGKGLAAVLLTLLLIGASACSDSPEWRTTAVKGAFPDLEFALIVDDGVVITEQDVHGEIALLFFGYMSCPDVCPATMAKLQAALDSLPDAKQGQVRVVFVSVDPERDTPQRLKDYARHFGPQFVAGTADIPGLAQLTRRYGSSFAYGPANDTGYYSVAHGSNVIAFGRDGSPRLLIRPEDSLEAIVHDLGRLVTGA